MRTAAELIEEIRFNTNRINKNRFTDASILRLLNTAQRQVQRTIFLANPACQHFTEDHDLTYSSDVETYALPAWAYTTNSVSTVFPMIGDHYNAPIVKIDEKERQYKAGYYVKGSNLIITKGSMGSAVSKARVVLWRKITELTAVGDTPALPDACEDFLTLFVERKIHYIDSSKDIINSGVFTKEEKIEIAGLFGDNSKDVSYPPVTDTS